MGDMTAHSVQAFGAQALHFSALQDCVTAAAKTMQKNVTVLVKGSRFMQMERAVDALEQKQTANGLTGDK